MPANQDQRDPIQLELILPELCFPGRDAVTAIEIKKKLGCTLQHIINCCEDENCSLVAINIGRKSRGAFRIPITSYYAWMIESLTSAPSENPVLNLETPKLILLFRQIAERLELRGEHPVKILTSKK